MFPKYAHVGDHSTLYQEERDCRGYAGLYEAKIDGNVDHANGNYVLQTLTFFTSIS